MKNLNYDFPGQLPETYVEIFYNSPLPQWIYDLTTLSFLVVNNAAIELYGYAREEFLNMTIRDIRLPEELPKLEEIIAKKVKRGYFNQSTVRHRTKN